MQEYDDMMHCPHCDGVKFSGIPEEAIITEDGVYVAELTCLTCGADDLFPSDLVPGYVVPEVE